MELDLNSILQQIAGVSAEKALARKIRGQASEPNPILQEANQRVGQFDLLNFATTAGSNNEGLANAVSALTKARSGRSAPVKMGETGFAVPETGQFVENPIYSQEKDDARSQSLVQALQSLAARRAMSEDSNLTKLLINQNSTGTRKLIAAMAAANKREEPAFKESEIQKLSAFADKKQLPRLMQNARQVSDALAKAEELESAGGSKVNIPGFGTTEKLTRSLPFGDRFLSKEAIDNMSAIEGMFNALTRADAGLSQTQGEVLRQAMETFNDKTASSTTKRQVFRQHIIPLIEAQRSATLGSASPAALAEYRARQEAIGGKVDWMEPVGTQTGVKPKVAAPKFLGFEPKGSP